MIPQDKDFAAKLTACRLFERYLKIIEDIDGFENALLVLGELSDSDAISAMRKPVHEFFEKQIVPVMRRNGVASDSWTGGASDG